jgi:hypothetical protein
MKSKKVTIHRREQWGRVLFGRGPVGRWSLGDHREKEMEKMKDERRWVAA